MVANKTGFMFVWLKHSFFNKFLSKTPRKKMPKLFDKPIDSLNKQKKKKYTKTQKLETKILSKLRFVF